MSTRNDELAGATATTADVYLDVQRRGSVKIRGEVQAEGHEGDIEVRGWAWGAQTGAAMGASAATARRQYRPLVITKRLDAASVPLLTALASNQALALVTLVMRKTGGEALDYFRLQLAQARVASIDVDVDADGRPVEHVTFTFTQFEVEYVEQQAGGGGQGGIVYSDEVLPAGS